MNADRMQAAHAQMEHLDVVERVERLAVVQEALTWLGTPYLHQGRIRGAGVDCGQLLECVFEGAGVIQPTKIEDYPHDWHLHRSEERYLETVERVAHKVDRDPLPGDIQAVALRKLRMLNNAHAISDLRSPPANRLEKLSQDREGRHSIRINDQWRVCFAWRDGDAYDVEITDYH